MKPNKINDLDDYMNNRLSKEKRDDINHRLQTDKDFAEEANVFFDLFKGFKGLEVDALQEKMNGWEAKHQSTQSQGRVLPLGNRLFRYVAAAVVLLAFLPLGYQVLFSSGSATPEEMFAMHFEHNNAMNMYSSRSATLTEEEGKTEEDVAKEEEAKAYASSGVDAYNNKNYKQAIQNFSAYLMTTESKSEDIQYYMAVSLLAENQLVKAKQSFKELLKDGSRARKADAQWYLVLTLLKENNVAEAQKHLNKVIRKKRSKRYKKKALKLKKQIEEYLAEK